LFIGHPPVGIDPIRFLVLFQGMNSDKGNGFSIFFKRDCHLSYFSRVTGTCDSNTMVRCRIKEPLLCMFVNPPRELFGNPPQREKKTEMVSILNVSSLFSFPIFVTRARPAALWPLASLSCQTLR